MKKFIVSNILVLIGLLLITGTSFGTTKTNEQSDTEFDHFLYFPIVFYSPENGFSAGIMGYYYINPEVSELGLEPDRVKLYLYGTQRGQTKIKMESSKYLADNTQKLLLKVSHSNDSVSDFFGIGPNTPDIDEEYSFMESTLEGSYLWEAKDHWYLGPTFYYSNNTITEREAGGMLDSGNVTGYNGTNAVGSGLHLIWDQYDRLEQKGSVFEAKGILYSKDMGSTEDFSTLELDYRHFFKIAEGHIFGVQGLLASAAGDVPFQFMPALGVDGIMRGYVSGRLRDLNSIAFQGEYRFPIHDHFSGVLFGSCGQVAPSLGELEFKDWKTTYGIGLRYMISQQQKINLRLDIAVSPDSTEFYLNLGEAF